MATISKHIKARLNQALGKTEAGGRAPVSSSVAKRRAMIVSYPKSGRTWLAVMLSKALNQIYGLDMGDEFSVAVVTKKIVEKCDANIAVTGFHHDSACFRRAHRFSYLRHDNKKEFVGQQVVLLVRDPRDVLVSSFHQIIDRDKNAHLIEPDISRFLRDEVYGIRKLIAFYESWERNRHVPASFTLVRYEDMHRDPAAALRSVLSAMNVARVDEAAVQNAVYATTFEKMQDIERQDSYRAGALAFVGGENVNAMKARKGKIKGYLDELSKDDVAFLDGYIRENGCPFYQRDELLSY